MAARKKQDFEARLARLTEIVETLEREDAPLEKGMALYREGVDLVTACREQLEKARYEVTVFNQAGELVPNSQEAQEAQEAQEPEQTQQGAEAPVDD